MIERNYALKKRCFDLALATTALLLSLPAQGVVALVVRCTMGKPVLFHQTRPGLHGKPFILTKFRTMTCADRDISIGDDYARVTRLGSLLRSTSLDELPTLWGVVRGDLSLVGPRPLLMRYLDLYTPEQARRHSMRPGLTGLAQVNGRNSLSWDDKLEFDCHYIDTASMSLDVKILAGTVRTVLNRQGIGSEGNLTANEFFGSAKDVGRA